VDARDKRGHDVIRSSGPLLRPNENPPRDFSRAGASPAAAAFQFIRGKGQSLAFSTI
jgi:hypothetical protein